MASLGSCTGPSGLLAGGALRALIYPALTRKGLGVGFFGTKTVPKLFRLSPAKPMGCFGPVVLLIFVLLEDERAVARLLTPDFAGG